MSDEPRPVDLRGLLASLRRRRWIIVATTALAISVAAVLALVTEPVYEGRAEVLIEPDLIPTDPEHLGRIVFGDQELETQLQLVSSEAVLSRVAARLDLDSSAAVRGRVQAALLPETRVMVVTARHPEPQHAAELAQTLAEEYLALRREQAVARIGMGRAEVERRLEQLRAELAQVDDEIAADDSIGPGQSAERWRLAEQVALMTTQLAIIEGGDEQIESGGGQIVEPARTPDRPVEPDLRRSALVALVLGLGAGLVLALLRDLLDDAVRSDADVEAATDRPVLGRVPLFSLPGEQPVPLLESPDTPEAEAYRDLRANLRFVASDLRSLAVTSPLEGEGKTSVATNVAIAASLAGFEVVLVDADLRKPAVHQALGVRAGVGLSDLLVDDHDLDGCLVAVSDPPLWALTAGSRPPNPSELLGSQRMAELLAELTDRFDLVILDTPPALAASDALEVASLCDQTLLVVADGETRRRALGESVERLERAGAQVAGSVLNRVDPRDLEYRYYHYSVAR